MARLALFGASGSTGQEVLRQALSRGHEIIAIERDRDERIAALDGVDLRTADAIEDDLAPVIEGADALVSCLGVGGSPTTLMDPPPLYTEGAKNIIAAMQANGLKRLVLMSATFVVAKDRGPIWFRAPAMAALDKVLTQMRAMEDILLASEGIDWTAVRPGWLMEGDLTADYHVQADCIPEDHIRSRHADVAHFMLNLVEGDDWVRQTPAISRKEPESASTPDKVVADMIA